MNGEQTPFEAHGAAAVSVEQNPNERLEVDNIVVGYDDTPVLDGVSFSVAHGGQVAVVGPNGAGKSTLFKALVGLLPLRSGGVLIHGKPLGHHLDTVAYVPQRGEVDWHFPVSVEDVVMMGRYRHSGGMKTSRQAERAAIATALEQMGITPLARKSIGDLSGGQQQRVFLARALAQRPHILLMDEPFSGVDVTTQEVTLDLLQQLKTQMVTVLVSTHDLNMAAERFETTLLLNRGVIAYGPASTVLTPENLQAAFGSHVLVMDGAVVVDECCSHGEEDRRHA